MAIPAEWYVRDGGNDLNSGATDADAPVINGDAGTPFVVTGGVNVEYAPGGINALAGTEGINLQVAGVDTIRGFTVVDDTHFTLDAAVADAAYAGRIGGARVTINEVTNQNAGFNVKITSDHVVWVEPVSFTQTGALTQAGTILRGNGGRFTIDGTGGAAGSDLVGNAGASTALRFLMDANLVNAVDEGLVTTQPFRCIRVLASACGGDGFQANNMVNLRDVQYCAARGCAGSGFTRINTGSYCEAADNGVNGYMADTSTANTDPTLIGCVAYDNLRGAEFARASRLNGCTFEGSTDSGLRMGARTTPEAFIAINCNFSNNGRYGIEETGADPDQFALVDYCNFYNNALGARLNVQAGPNDTAFDPQFVDAANDDYTLDTGSPLIGAGYSPFKSPMKLNIGATIAEVAAAAAGGGPALERGLAG
jgi:hypothetical protein